MPRKQKPKAPQKPRDIVTLREITHGTGTGAHRDKKREAKNGILKHKGREPDPGSPDFALYHVLKARELYPDSPHSRLRYYDQVADRLFKDRYPEALRG